MWKSLYIAHAALYNTRKELVDLAPPYGRTFLRSACQREPVAVAEIGDQSDSKVSSARQTMKPDTRNWLDMSEYDVETARHMLATGRYLYVVFMCHLALEKMLKAHVTAVTQSIPPKTHDLIYLVKQSGLAMPQPYLDFIGKINNASVPTRYPDDLPKMIAQYPESVVRDYLERTEEVLQWLRQHPNLR